MAHVGYILRSHIQSFIWDNGWVVVEAYELANEDFIPDGVQRWELAHPKK